MSQDGVPVHVDADDLAAQEEELVVVDDFAGGLEEGGRVRRSSGSRAAAGDCIGGGDGAHREEGTRVDGPQGVDTSAFLDLVNDQMDESSNHGGAYRS